LLSKEGFSLFELIVIVVILMVILLIAVPMFGKYARKYYTENEINTIYTDLMTERFKAISTGIPRGMIVDSPTKYTLFTFDDKNFNLIFDGATEEADPLSKTLKIPLNGPAASTVILFDNRGMSRSANWGIGNFTIYINIPARFNCIVVSAGRIRKGVWNGSSCEAR